MRMTTFKLILIRLFNATLGRSNYFSKIFKRMLIALLIKNKKEKYAATSKFFSFEELE